MEGGEGPDETRTGRLSWLTPAARGHRRGELPVRRRSRGADVAPPEPPDIHARRSRSGARADRGRRGRRRGGGQARGGRARRRPSPSPCHGGRGLHHYGRALECDRRGHHAAPGRDPPHGCVGGARHPRPVPERPLGRPRSDRGLRPGYGFERAMDNFGAIVGPLLALTPRVGRWRPPGDPAPRSFPACWRRSPSSTRPARVALPSHPRAPTHPAPGSARPQGHPRSPVHRDGRLRVPERGGDPDDLARYRTPHPFTREHQAAQIALLLYVGTTWPARCRACPADTSATAGARSTPSWSDPLPSWSRT